RPEALAAGRRRSPRQCGDRGRQRHAAGAGRPARRGDRRDRGDRARPRREPWPPPGAVPRARGQGRALQRRVRRAEHARRCPRRRAAGLRPISNVVDVTNYVLWELGHPLHAFDAATVADATIVVRRAGDGERFITLDGQARTLDSGMCVIADPQRAIGLGGVMGGRNSEVTESTTRVLLESAYFDPVATRRTSRTLGLKTDAAYRFERGADIEGLVDAGARTAALIAELGGGTLARGMIDAYPRKRRPVRVRLRMSRVQRVLGLAPPPATARRILTGLGLPVRARGRDLEVDVPSFRRDLAIEDDLVEEIIRVWGYHRIPTTFSRGDVAPARDSDTGRQERLVREILVGAGLAECVTWAFGDPAKASALGAASPLKLLNPLSQDAAALREHPLEGL